MKVRRGFHVAMKQNMIGNENIAYFSFMMYYIWQTGNLFAQKCFGSGTLISNAMYLILAAGVGGAVLSVARKKAAWGILAELVVVFFYTLSYTLGYADTFTLSYNFAWTFAICVPIGLVILCIDDYEKLYRLLYTMAKPMIGILCGTIFLKFIILRADTSLYDEAMSYALIFWCIILSNAVLEKVRCADILFLSLGLGFNLLWGSRATYFCFVCFILLKTVFDVEAKRRQTLIFLGGTILLIVIAVFFVTSSDALGSLMDGLIHFRSLHKLLNGELFQSDARIDLYLYYAGLIIQKPFLGWGVTGGWLSAGEWPHSFFIEP